VQQIARDRPVLVVVLEIGVQAAGEIELGVVGKEATDHLKRPATEP